MSSDLANFPGANYEVVPPAVGSSFDLHEPSPRPLFDMELQIPLILVVDGIKYQFARVRKEKIDKIQVSEQDKDYITGKYLCNLE